jgi:hypothetical protein
MDQQILNTLTTLSKNSQVNSVFKTRITPNNPSKIVLNTEKWLLQLYQGTFIDSKFDTEWLKYHGITKELFKPFIGNMESLLSLFSKCVIDCANVSDFYDAFDEFLYSPNTFKSGFLRHAMKFLGKEITEKYKRLLSKDTFKQVINTQEKASTSVWCAIVELEEWFNTNKEAIIRANSHIITANSYLTLDSFIYNFLSYVNTHIINISVGILKPNSYMFWQWVAHFKRETGVNFSPDIKDVIKIPAKVSESVVKPRDYMLMPMEKRIIWDLQNDPKKRFRKEIHEFWEHCSGDSVEMLEYLLER